MTGYGRTGFSLGGTELSLEISTVNRRGLEIFVSGPQEWTGLERLVSAWVREQVARGKVSLIIQTASGNGENALSWEMKDVAETLRKLEQQAGALGVAFTPDAAVLLRLAELHRIRREALPPLDTPEAQVAIRDAVRGALGQLLEMRTREGEFLARDLLARIQILETLLGKVLTHGTGVVARHRELLFSRLQQAGLELDLGDERVLKEVALFADRCDISEETTRLHSHLGQFKICLLETGDVGRKLDFLCQEINRELNTIGSKANQLEITHCVIEGKNELERIREQVQNVE
jgi:uncharacterized protein (TIGR00255 family)